MPQKTRQQSPYRHESKERKWDVKVKTRQVILDDSKEKY
tara:strand:+ start:1108 stop:1224 length:117 start_codon:yes stop_codon:yes gene_type:complete